MSASYFGPFGLKEAPFTKEIADTDLWLPTSKAAVVDELCEALSERASVLLTGDPDPMTLCTSSLSLRLR
jgi:general secretion pathway protein A